MVKEFNEQEYNKMCAEFLSGILYKPKPWYYFPRYNEHWYFPNREYPNRFVQSDLKFDSDWNWIMKVVKQIYRTISPSSDLKHDLIQCVGRCDKERSVQAIWNFLNSYKENNANDNSKRLSSQIWEALRN